MDFEEWRPVKYYPGYFVSDKGNVMSNRFKTPPIILKPKLRWDGYYEVALWKKGKRKFYKVHRLVMITFFPIKGTWQLQVNHKDKNRINNAFTNLEWCTPAENIKHKIEMYKLERKEYQEKRKREKLSQN